MKYVKIMMLNIYEKITVGFSVLIERAYFGKKVDFSKMEKRGSEYKTDYAHYQASLLGTNNWLSELRVNANDSILDIGCGKGKMVYYFSKKGFGRSDGIEFSKALSEIAISNMQVLDAKCNIYNIDATLFDEYERYNYFYFYNPFGNETMSVVVDCIKKSIISNPRKVYLIYLNPICHDLIKLKGFRLVTVDTNWFKKISGMELYIYTN